MNYLRQSTSATINVGPFVDALDGDTPETSLVISASEVRLAMNGAPNVAKNDSTSAVHDENGYYIITLDTTDSGTAGALRVSVDKTEALPVWEDFTVLPVNIYDSLIVGTDTLDAVMVSATSAATADIFGTTIDTKTFEEVLEILLAMASGKIVRTGVNFSFYKQDDATVLYTLKSESGARTRL